jgi:hypothetical protein
MATTPPAGTMQSTAEISRASCPISASDSTPIVCVPGSTRSGPLSVSESSMWRRNAITRDRAVAGAWAYVIPALMDQGRQPGMSRCSRKGSAVSWCQTTSQLLPGDLSNNVARNGIAAGPTKRAAIATSRESCAIRWATGTCIKCRATARPRSSVECWSSVATFSKPFVMRKYEFNEGAVAMRNVRSSPSNPFKCIGAQPRHAKKGASQALRPRTAALFWIRFSVHYRH